MASSMTATGTLGAKQRARQRQAEAALEAAADSFDGQLRDLIDLDFDELSRCAPRTAL